MGESAAGAAVRLAVRQLEGRIGAGSAASYVELGRRASTHAHSVELAGLQSTGRCATTTIQHRHASHSPQTCA